MKLIGKILAGFLIVLILIGAGLRIYFNDERLREMVVPMINESVGTEVEVGNMSLSIFTTFPDAGISMSNFVLPDPDGEEVAVLDELLVSIEIIPLLSDEIVLSELTLNSPRINYVVHEDSTTNIDFLLSEPAEETTSEGSLSLSIPELTVNNGQLRYADETSAMLVTAEGLNATLGLRYAELIETDLESEVGNLTVNMQGENYLSNMQLSFNQQSVLDLENELLSIEEGQLDIRGLALNLSGKISNWSSEALQTDLSISSSSDDFGALLGLVPPEYEEYIAGLETRGALALEGTISGAFSEEQIPDFNFDISVEDGYLKNNDLPEAIQDIQFSFTANNQQISIHNFNAVAATNEVSITGVINNPMEENPGYDLEIMGNADLSTVKQFYPIQDFDIEDLAGQLTIDVSANGFVQSPEQSSLDGQVSLSNGRLKYAGVARPIEDISAEIQATQQQIRIQNAGLSAAGNTVTVAGVISNPLDENSRSIDVSADIAADLGTIKEFYPIDEDTLSLRGNLNSEIVLRGKLDTLDIQQLLQNSTVSLKNGYVAHQSVGEPLRDITFEGTINGRQLQIQNASFKTGQNSLALDGSISEYLSDDPVFDLNIKGEAFLEDVGKYYSLEPYISELEGKTNLNLSAKGPAGNPQNIDLNGRLTVENVMARGDSLPLPVSDLSGQLTVSPRAVQLPDFYMKLGASDIQISGSLLNYLAMMSESASRNLPYVKGDYKSELLNLDEMIDWDEETDPDAPVPIELPEMNGAVTAEIGTMRILGINITEVSGEGTLSPEEVTLKNANLSMFGGTASGNMVWKVPEPTATNIDFSGSLDSLEASAFFRETSFLGEDSNIHEYVEGAFSADIKYNSDLAASLSPKMETAVSEGSFGMSKARLNGHPVQVKVAEVLKIQELRNVALDEWTATYSIADGVLMFDDFNLTSGNIGVELEGTQHLINDEINFKATISLPERFKKGIASVISQRAADALQREDGTLGVPLSITGTSQNPQVRPDMELIQQIIKDSLKDTGKDLLKNLFDG
ncbi:AsmA-like C-terminal region-containing protein [Gracilimonas mengyeensis]|uniref:AsmA-like C-terminal region n=1 Tax=Gracilimonas mengyeensis TaxID=1302730 RepID=A0A521E9E7_9BACT|nr:AsmA-like C-terminal region-containing protein [Gracilimonas mengyeensis]SMO80575.1 AsmA-like C-terminal region [Gracilimonas mengyeensis]